MDTAYLQQLARSHGVEYRGAFGVKPEDKVPDMAGGKSAVSLCMFGQIGASVWPTFSQSTEYADSQPHPLDRWSKRVGTRVAEALQGQLLLPFGPAPFHPFIQWARRVEDVHASPLGLLIHPEYGLWHAYRFAVAISCEIENDHSHCERQTSACAQCEKKPCLTTCPVDAFNGNEYNVIVCFNHLKRRPDSDCHAGCLAREACPEGGDYHYEKAQKVFHMQQFYKAMQQRTSSKGR